MTKKGKDHPHRATKVVDKTHPANQVKPARATRLSAALALYEQGEVRKAKRILIKIMEKEPFNADGAYHLGLIAKVQGKYDEAIKYWERAISIVPANIDVYFSLGGLFIDQRNYEKAREQFQEVISLAPAHTNAWYNLGIIAGGQGNYAEAIKHYEKVLGIDPSYTNAYYNLGWVFLNSRKYDEAIRYFEKVISLDPRYVDAFFNIGSALQNKRDYDQAIGYYEKTLTINPRYYQAYNNLGVIYQYQYDFDKAIECYEKAIALHAEAADAYMNMGNVYREKGDVQKAIEYYKKSLSIAPSLVALNNLCGYQKEQCNYEEVYDLTLKMMEYEAQKKHDLAAIHDTFIQLCEWERASKIIERFKTAELDPDGKDVLAGSFMEFCAITDLSLDEIAEQHKTWGKLTEERVTPFSHVERGACYRGKRKVRLGYSSPDLREHSVGYLIKDIIASHNREEFEIYCYGNFDPKDADDFTREITARSDRFKNIKHLSDREVAHEIYNDEIDILIDLAGHTAGHRLRAMAYKPAPLQITYLGYPNTTGLSRIDYRITDRFAESEPEKDDRYSEQLIRLTNCFLAFKGFGSIVPPEVKQGTCSEVIFGCFNNIQKLTPSAVELWSRILTEVKNSRLHLKAKQLNTTFVWDNIVKEFAKHGIAEDRLRCLEYTPTREEHLRYYNDIDVALDTFPYNGTVTTLEALWMNVPIVTLVGESHAQRVGYSILKNLGLDSLIAYSGEEYVGKCSDMAYHPEVIRELKTRMRTNLLASSICNPRVITREMELNYKRIWTEYLRAGERPAEAEAGRHEGEICHEEASMENVIAAASRLRMAMVKLKAGELQQAIEIASELLEVDGIAPLAWYVRGVAQHRLGEEGDAIAALSQSLRLNSKNAGVWKLLGEIHIARAEVEKANKCLEKVWELEQARL